jgi:uncharacterized repeat protein (TIGR03847 family)
VRIYDTVESWVAGATGRPGERTFMIQFTADDGTHAYVLEKAQVAALVMEARRLLGVIGGPAERAAARTLDDGVVPEFRVAEIHLSFEESESLVRIRLLPTTDDVDVVEFAVGPAVFGAALPAAQRAVEGGRPACPRCGLAMDPDGHHCPVTNGDLRGHRP